MTCFPKIFFLFLIGMAVLNCSGSPPSTESAEPVADQEPSDDSPEDESSSSFIPTSAESWTVIYDGYGFVDFNEADGIVMEPLAATSSDETHSALVLAKITEECPIADFTLTIEAVTEEQLRSEFPNPWEVFWIFFNYLPDGDFKTTNYFVLKTNGLELGRAFDETGQEFLFTAGEPQLNVGASATYRLDKTASHVLISIDGVEVLDYESSTWPEAIYDQPGAIGLYTEDARVKITSVSLESDELIPCF